MAKATRETPEPIPPTVLLTYSFQRVFAPSKSAAVASRLTACAPDPGPTSFGSVLQYVTLTNA
eukprot:10175065-Lingulodinium_polyedra.AAC.1